MREVVAELVSIFLGIEHHCGTLVWLRSRSGWQIDGVTLTRLRRCMPPPRALHCSAIGNGNDGSFLLDASKSALKVDADAKASLRDFVQV
jgi:hypothetical protein